MKKLILSALLVVVIPCAAQVNVQGSSIQIGGDISGGVPGGDLYEGQIKAGSTAFGGLGIYSDITKSHLETYIPVRNWVYNSRQTEDGAYVGGSADCSQTETVGGGNEGHVCYPETFINAAKGWSAGPGYSTNQGWYVTQLRKPTLFSFTPGISQYMTVTQNCNKVGDCANIYSYLWTKGSVEGNSDEGAGNLSLNGGNSNHIFAGYTSTNGTGVSTVQGYNYSDAPEVWGYLMDLTNGPSHSTQICGNPDPNTVTDCGTHPVSDYIGHAIAAIETGGPNVNNGGTTLTVTVTRDGGTSGAGLVNGYVRGACLDFGEDLQATVTALSGGTQQLTAKFLYSHPAGYCKFFQDTTGQQGIMDLVADREDIGLGPTIPEVTSYYIAGAPDATHYYMTNYLAAVGTTVNQALIYPKRHNFGTTTGPSLTRASNVAKACGVDPAFAGGQTIAITGYSDATYNGTFTTSNLDASGNFCMTWANAGADGGTSGGTIATGGAVGGASSSGAANIWPAARIQQALTTTVTNSQGKSTTTFNGGMLMFPNAVTFHNGDIILNPNQMSLGYNSIFAGEQLTGPPTPYGNHGLSFGFGGPGTIANVYGIKGRNNQPWTYYRYGGGNGQASGPTFAFSPGPWGTGWHSDAPLQGGTVIEVGDNPPINSGHQSWYNLLSLAGQGGNPDLVGRWYARDHVFRLASQYGNDAGVEIHTQFADPGNNPGTVFITGQHFILGTTDAGACTTGSLTYNAAGLVIKSPCPTPVTGVMKYVGTKTTTASTTDNLTVTGLTTSNHCNAQQTGEVTPIAFTLDVFADTVTLYHDVAAVGDVLTVFCDNN